MFWKKNSENGVSLEFENRLQKIEIALSHLQNDILEIQSSHKLIRDKILRRFRDKGDENQPSLDGLPRFGIENPILKM